MLKNAFDLLYLKQEFAHWMNTGLGVQNKSLEGNFQLRDYPKSGLSNTDYRILPDTYFNRNDKPESKIVQISNKFRIN